MDAGRSHDAWGITCERREPPAVAVDRLTAMCHYCGCRNIPLIIDYIAEHEVVSALSIELVNAFDAGDLERADRLRERLAAELRSHWDGEENGLFEAMRGEDEYADYIAALVQEHRDLDSLLRSADLSDPEDQRQIRIAAVELEHHIRKEEDGLFPASLTALDGAAWNAAIEAWQRAHPGSVLRTQGS